MRKSTINTSVRQVAFKIRHVIVFLLLFFLQLTKIEISLQQILLDEPPSKVGGLEASQKSQKYNFRDSDISPV